MEIETVRDQVLRILLRSSEFMVFVIGCLVLRPAIAIVSLSHTAMESVVYQLNSEFWTARFGNLNFSYSRRCFPIARPTLNSHPSMDIGSSLWFCLLSYPLVSGLGWRRGTLFRPL
ncbi:hypothetical protein BKA65DRAFT_226574 [Rhexocercosporidium sp. MPI-PUGE-AT-0058]|nr:hypothetical protein BKA65DRAFT_226574 [Rhexocercosporidium sp. MPI-PUGE-AT-0058]